MKRTINNIAYWLCLPFVFPVYLIVDSWRNLKRKKHRHHLHRMGRSTEPNPYCDKF